ncbi:hypothetical protein [Streptomyces sp. WAC08241]|uniref:hypothetical protein n=1 Tax=Streptomyces sp. WAC08241 TaxID=2487421 RepID=UPI000F78721B|nr:hypothetical protein [Streptomyces sp. WAC08241]RSS37460.1 hypothetical protein EF906_23075 [Streptomyces sp. WAC08241]
MTTPADELRAAANAVRFEPEWIELGRDELFGALAKWLDVAAEYAERWAPTSQTNSPFREQALVVARAINSSATNSAT